VCSGVAVCGLLAGVLAGTASSGATPQPAAHAGSTTLTVAFPPGAEPTSVLPFDDAAACTSANLGYWTLMYRPGYWFGLGASTNVQFGLSPLAPPAFTSDASGNTVVTLRSRGWKWTNGHGGSEAMTAQDVNFWLNMDRAQEDQGASAACGFAKGFGIPDQVASVVDPGGPGGDTVQLTFDAKLNTTWLLDNELSQIDPMPVAWDLAAGGAAAGSGGCSTESFSAVTTGGKDRCSKVFNYLSSLQINDPVWNWADGPYRQVRAPYAGGLPSGSDVQVANAGYSGPVKPRAAMQIDYTAYLGPSGPAEELAALQAGRLDFGYLGDAQVARAPGPGRAGRIVAPRMAGYQAVGGVIWGVYYWMFNFAGASSSYPVSRANAWVDELNQPYFRAAMQEAIDQPGLIADQLHGYGVDTFSAIPAYPRTADAAGVTNPYPFSVKKARGLLAANGWDVARAPAVCERGGPVGCGSSAYPIPKGAKALLDLLYPTSSPSMTSQVTAEVATLASAGIEVKAASASPANVASVCLGGAEPWQLCGYGGWIYDPDVYPSGEVLFAGGAPCNAGGYSSTEMASLVTATTSGAGLGLDQRDPSWSTSYAQYTATALPFLWQPTPTSFTVEARSLRGALAPNPLGDVNPEYLTAI
jgi:peptide/nickel transport system substrate-binding protein